MIIELDCLGLLSSLSLYKWKSRGQSNTNGMKYLNPNSVAPLPFSRKQTVLGLGLGGTPRGLKGHKSVTWFQGVYSFLAQLPALDTGLLCF